MEIKVKNKKLKVKHDNSFETERTISELENLKSLCVLKQANLQMEINQLDAWIAEANSQSE